MTTSIEKYNQYPFPSKDFLDKYKHVGRQMTGGWATYAIDVYRRVSGTTEDIAENWEKIAEYPRNYSILNTFHPFQQYRDGVWRDYALISTHYTRVEVMDLETGEIIAVEKPPTVSKEMAEKFPDLEEGKEMPSWGFCPMNFYVPSWWDEYDESFQAKVMTTTSADERFSGELLNEFKLFEGNWAIYSGCVWGDDTSAKIRYIDLSRITEGIVITDDRFGYVEQPDQLELKDTIRILPSMNRISISVPIPFDIETGKAQHKGYIMDAISWEEKE